MKKIVILFVAAISLSSCNKPTLVEFTYDFSNVPLKLEAPVTPGPNSFQAEVPLNLDELFKTNHADRSKINDVTIESIELNMQGGRNFNNFENLVVNFFSDKNNMTKLASLSPVPKESTILKPVATEKADIHKYFSENSLFIIIDANMTEMDTLGYEMLMNMKLKFSAAEKK
ncbi:MAG: hypothetical protein N2167_04720 [Flavobacteriales bacterium]|nr:hypothetical protein [Flavobacteriales bacterium]